MRACQGVLPRREMPCSWDGWWRTSLLPQGCRRHGPEGVPLPPWQAHVPEPPVQDVADFQALLPEDGFGENAHLADDTVFLSLQAQGAIAELGVWKAAHAFNPGEHVLAREGIFPGVHDLNVPHEGVQGVEVAFLKPAQEKPGRDKGLKHGLGLEHDRLSGLWWQKARDAREYSGSARCARGEPRIFLAPRMVSGIDFCDTVPASLSSAACGQRVLRPKNRQKSGMRSLPGWCLWLLPKVSVPDRPCSPVRKVVDAQRGAADERRIVLPALTLCCGACRPVSKRKLPQGE